MATEFSGIERRLDELSERLARLQPLTAKARQDFAADPYLRDIVERNLEIAAQCCLDIAHRIICTTSSALESWSDNGCGNAQQALVLNPPEALQPEE
jgi:uncharacterized protein YutE (UPF0331/DUF86 family)